MLRKRYLSLAAVLFATAACAAGSTPPGIVQGNNTAVPGHCWQVSAAGVAIDSGATCGTGASGVSQSTGTASQVLVNGDTASHTGATIYSLPAGVSLGTPGTEAGSLGLAGATSGTATVASPASGGGTLTLPAGTDTLVGRATTDTLTNKTLTAPVMTAPVLGTPASGTLTNATGLPISTGVNGLGTGVATALGTNVGSAGSPVVNGGALGTPSSGTLTNAAGLVPSTGLAATGTPSVSTCLLGNNTWGSCSGSGSVSTTGSPATGNLTKFSGASTITNGDLSGDCATSGTLAVTCNKASSSVFGVAKVDGTTITASGGVISAVGGGSVSVTAGTPSIVINPTPGTSTFTVGSTYLINAQTGTSYTVVSGDATKLLTFSNASAVAVSLPQATGSFAAGFAFDVQNKGAGLVTITPTTSTINGSATLTVAQNTGCSIVSDGTNWQISGCTALASSGGSGTVNSGTSGQMTYYAGTGTAVSGNSNATISSGTMTLGTASTTQGNLKLNGGTSGSTTISPTATAGSTTATLPANTGTIAELNVAQNWTAQQSNCITTLTISTTTFTPDGTCNNYKLTLTGSDTIANPSATPVAGTSGIIAVLQDATGSRTATWGSQYIAAGGVATLTLSTGASAQDYVSYYVIDSTHILLSMGALNASH